MDAVGIVITVIIGVAGLFIGVLQLRQSRRQKGKGSSLPPAPVETDGHAPEATLDVHTYEPHSAYDHATQSALAIVPPPTHKAGFHVRYIETPGELHALWRIDEDAYGRASIAYETFETWWSAYPYGLKALFASTEVVGAIGIWPVSKHWAGELRCGRCRERDLPKSALAYYHTRPAAFWYVSGIVLRSDLRGTHAARQLLTGALHLWITSEQLDFPLEVLALAYSSQGELLLRRFEFRLLRNSRQTQDGFPLYFSSFATREAMMSSFARRGFTPEVKQ